MFARRVFGILVHDVRKRSTESVKGITGSGLSRGSLGGTCSAFIVRHDNYGFISVLGEWGRRAGVRRGGREWGADTFT